MKTNVGLWIDHRKAIIVTITDKGAAIGLTVSAVDKQLRRTGSTPLKGPFSSLQVPADDVKKRKFVNHLNIYYDMVIASLAKVDSILIFGPGEAKNELMKRLKLNNLEGRVVSVKTADKMTQPQIAARVQKYFAEE